jgi:hypothetical protein
LEKCISRLRGHPEGPETLSARCSTVEPEKIAKAPPATPTMQAVQDSWMGLVSRRASGLWVWVAAFGEPVSRGPVQLFIINDD